MQSEFACDVRIGLSKPQKELHSKYLYDDLGSALFDAITLLPEYGLTRADERLLTRYAAAIPREFSCVAELGSGSGRKTRPVLEALRAPRYFPSMFPAQRWTAASTSWRARPRSCPSRRATSTG
jgi:uncharacterized SAM-dependent methyltransferase